MTFGGASTGITYSSRAGQYTIIGNVVYFTFVILLSSKGSSTGLAAVTGLPVAAGATVGNYQNIGSLAGGSFSAGSNAFMGVIFGGTTSISLYETTPLNSFQLNDTNFTNTSSFGITGFYWNI